MITDRDITDEVKAALGTDADDFDIPAIVNALRERFGSFGETDKLDVDHDEFWALVWAHMIEGDECEGHESLSGPAGVSAYCDGSCRRR